MLQAPRIVRWTLPALLLTLVVGGFAIVAASGRGGESQSAAPASPTASRHGRKPRRVKVHSGDTPSSIARRAHLSVGRLLELNPGVDPRLLRPGQRLAISR
ncbi:MAG: LysM domain [Solirubrobacteraceae bacterium]|jgi:LysM repeat protein|nr:LysM domain [Solirubrobacteraceae bacterium]